MTCRLGVAPIAWLNDDRPEISAHITLEQCLAEARQAGYRGIESGGSFPLDAAELGPLLERHGLRLVSGWYGAELRRRSAAEEKLALRAQLDLFKALGAPVMVFAETFGSVQGRGDTPLSRRPRMADDEWKAYGDKLTEVAEHMAAEGVPMSFHHHMGTVIEVEEEVDRLMEVSGEAVGLLVDSGHIHFAGGDPARVARRHGPRVNHVHCKDVRPARLQKLRDADGSFLDGVLDGVFTVPGDGGVDFDGFLGALVEIGYGGWLVVEAEQDPKKADPLIYAKLGFSHLMRAASAVGMDLQP